MVENVILRGEYFNIVISTSLIAIKLQLLPKQSRLLERDPECKPKQNMCFSLAKFLSYRGVPSYCSNLHLKNPDQSKVMGD